MVRHQRLFEYIDLDRESRRGIGLENGVLGAIHRRVIGKCVAQSAIPSALLPHNAIMQKIVPVCALL